MSLDIILALGGGAGIAAVIKVLIDSVGLVRGGVAAKEKRRKEDIVQQRDDAIHEAEEWRAVARREAARADAARAVAYESDRLVRLHRANENRAREHAADVRLMAMERFGARRDDLPAWPDMDDTTPRATLDVEPPDGGQTGAAHEDLSR